MAEFNLEGLLGNIGSAFGGGGNYLDEYLTPEQRAAMQRNAMLAASAALLKAGGESTRRIGIGEALGGAFEAGQAGYEKAQTGALTQIALKQKLDEAKKAKALQEMIAGVFKTQAAAPGAAPVDAMPVNPTVARANQYRQAAQMLAMSGQGEQAMKYEDLAQKLDPRDEVQGAPIEVTNAEGNPVLLQQMKSGAFRPVVGYGAKQGTIGQPFEVTGPDGKPMLVQQMPDGNLREVVGVSAKQAAPGDPIEMTDAQGKSVMVQKMPDGSFRPVAGYGAKQEAAVAPIEVTGPDGKPMLVTPQRGGGYTPVVGISPKQNPSEKSRQLAELGLPPTLENFQLLESSPNEIKLLNKMGMPVTMANVEQIRRAGAASTVVNMNEGQKGFENEMKLGAAFRGEPIYKDFSDMRSAYGQVMTSLDAGTPIGDVAGATKIMKLLDPGSVVRESELGIAMASAGRMDRLKNYFNNLMTGQKLTPTQRQDFKTLSNELYAVAGQAYNQKRSEYKAFGDAYKFPNLNTSLGAPADVPSIVRQPGGPVAAPGMGGGGLTWDPAQKKFVNR